MKHILITGGADGLGRVLAKKLVDQGHVVTILDNDAAMAEQTAQALDCSFVVADVSKADEVRAAVERVGKIDILVNNAGVWIQGELETNDDEAIRRTLEVNTLGSIYMAKAAVPIMQRQGGGRIINVISQAGLNAKAERSVYRASKWAMTGFTKSIQLELRPHGIAVTGFYPGLLNTRLFEKAGDNRDMSGALDPAIAADAIVYICGLADYVEVPELGIDSLRS